MKIFVVIVDLDIKVMSKIKGDHEIELTEEQYKKYHSLENEYVKFQEFLDSKIKETKNV